MSFTSPYHGAVALSILVIISSQVLTTSSQTTDVGPACGASVGCMYYNKGGGQCGQPPDCDIILQYSGNANEVKFNVQARLDDDMYVAVGLSDDQRMGRDEVHACVRTTPAPAIPHLFRYYNPGTPSTYTPSLLQGSSNTDIDSLVNVNGFASCVFVRQNVSVENSRGPLVSPTYLLLAYGSISATGRVERHAVRPMISPVSVVGDGGELVLLPLPVTTPAPSAGRAATAPAPTGPDAAATSSMPPGSGGASCHRNHGVSVHLLLMVSTLTAAALVHS